MIVGQNLTCPIFSHDTCGINSKIIYKSQPSIEFTHERRHITHDVAIGDMKGFYVLKY